MPSTTRAASRAGTRAASAKPNPDRSCGVPCWRCSSARPPLHSLPGAAPTGGASVRAIGTTSEPTIRPVRRTRRRASQRRPTLYTKLYRPRKFLLIGGRSRRDLHEVPVLDPSDSLDLATLRARYRAGAIKPVDLMAALLDRIAARGDDKVWIHLLPRDEILGIAEAVTRRGAEGKRLFGVPF